MRLLLAAVLSGLLLSASCGSEKPTYRQICNVPGAGDPDAVGLLARHHGLRTLHGPWDLGGGPLLVEGSLDDAFLARECLRTHDHARGATINSWPADVVTLPGDPTWPSFRVAAVDFAVTRPVAADLEAEGIEVDVYFGTTTDFHYVPRADSLKAWSVLRANPRKGLVPLHPDFERLPPPFDALPPLSKDDPDLARALEVLKRFPEPAWGLGRRILILDAAERGGTPTPQEQEYLDVTPLWLRARAYSAKRG